MPTIGFEIWCEQCGSGICNNTKEKRGSINEFTTFCDCCHQEREELREDRNRFESEVDELKDRVFELESEIDELRKGLD